MSRDFGTRTRIGGYLNTRAGTPARNYPPSTQRQKKKKEKGKKGKRQVRQLWEARPALPASDDHRFDFGTCFRPLDKIATAFGQRVFRCPAPPLLYRSFKCNVELLHLQRCFSTQYKIPYHPSPLANQSTSSRSRRNKASLHPPPPQPLIPPCTMLSHVRSR